MYKFVDYKLELNDDLIRFIKNRYSLTNADCEFIDQLFLHLPKDQILPAYKFLVDNDLAFDKGRLNGVMYDLVKNDYIDFDMFVKMNEICPIKMAYFKRAIFNLEENFKEKIEYFISNDIEIDFHSVKKKDIKDNLDFLVELYNKKSNVDLLKIIFKSYDFSKKKNLEYHVKLMKDIISNNIFEFDFLKENATLSRCVKEVKDMFIDHVLSLDLDDIVLLKYVFKFDLVSEKMLNVLWDKFKKSESGYRFTQYDFSGENYYLKTSLMELFIEKHGFETVFNVNKKIQYKIVKEIIINDEQLEFILSNIELDSNILKDLSKNEGLSKERRESLKTYNIVVGN